MDGWYLDDDGGQSFFSSGGYSSEFYDPSRTSFNSTGSSLFSGLIHDKVLDGCLEPGASNFIEQKFCQGSVFMGCDNRETEFEVPVLSQVDANIGDNHHKSLHAYKGNGYQSFAPSRDDLAITQAMVALISSSSTSSTSSSSLLYQPSLQVQTHGQSKGTCDQLSAFRPYNPLSAPDTDKRNLCGQKMMRASLSMLRKIDQCMKEEGRTRETQSSSIQTQHIISERKRREKLNDNFHTLRLLLPPGSKKDKASVLINTKSYLSTLRGHISKLEEENAKLEMHVLSAEEVAHDNELIDKVKFQIIKGVKSISDGLQQIELKISVSVGCDVIELVLHILECLRGMRLARLTSFNVITQSHRLDQPVEATLKLQIKNYDWDEEWFKETMCRWLTEWRQELGKPCDQLV